MDAYILIMIADFFLTAAFVFQKKFQRCAGISLKAGLVYNLLHGLFSAAFFLIVSGFKITISAFSVFMAASFATAAMLCIIMGFRIMQKGNMSLYTLFLMSGGMIEPYLWGVMLLGEKMTVAGIIGLAAIAAAIIISNSGVKKPDKTQLILCIAVFILNGATSIASKMHQMNPVSARVSVENFAFIIAVMKVIVCSLSLLVCRNKMKENTRELKLFRLMPIIFAAAAAEGIFLMMQLIGASSLPASVMFPIVTGGTVILSSVAGSAVFREKLSSKQWAGIVLCFIGTVLFL